MNIKINRAVLYLILCYMFQFCESGGNTNGRIVIAGLFPLSESVPEGVIGRGVKPAVDLAVGMVNKNKEILPNHHLQIVHNDTKVNSTSQKLYVLFHIYLLSAFSYTLLMQFKVHPGYFCFKTKEACLDYYRSKFSLVLC